MGIFNRNIFSHNVFNVFIPIGIPPKPHIVHIPAKFALPLEKLGLIERYDKQIHLSSLSLKKLKRVNILLSELSVSLPTEMQMLLDDLALMSNLIQNQLPLKDLKMVKPKLLRLPLKDLTLSQREWKETLIEDLKLLEREKQVYFLHTLNLSSKIKLFLKAKIPNIYLLKMKSLMKYLELMDLLDSLGED